MAAEVTWLISLAAVILIDLALWRGRTAGPSGWHLEPAREPWPRRCKDDERIIIGHIKHVWIDWKDLDIPSSRDHIDVSIRGQITVVSRPLPHPLHGIHHIRILG